MALSNFRALQELKDIQIAETIIDCKKELFNLRLQRATRQSFKAHTFKHTKRKIAQLLTLQSQRKANNN